MVIQAIPVLIHAFCTRKRCLPDPLRDGAILLPLLGKLLLDPEGLQGRHSNVFSSEKQTINI